MTAWTLHPTLPTPHGHPPDSSYVSWFWLPILGPTATLAWARCVELLDRGERRIEDRDLADMLGVRPDKARQAISRLAGFHVVAVVPETPTDALLVVKADLPSLSPRRLNRLSGTLRRMEVDVRERSRLSAPPAKPSPGKAEA